MEETGRERTAVVVEDDADVRLLLAATLSQAGFTVHTAGSGADGVAAVREYAPAVVTLDLSLPDIDGFEVCRRIRAFSDAYVVMLTGRSEEIDTLLGLESGADDYLTKPFRPRELRARVEAMLRRPRRLGDGDLGAPSAGAPVPPAPADQAAPASGSLADGASPAAGAALIGRPGQLVHRGLRVDTAARMVDIDGTPVHLTRSEFDLLAALVAEPNRVLRKAELVRRLWGQDYDTGTPVLDSDLRTVEVHMANLRRKLGDDAASPRFVVTVRGVGYRLAPAV
ncbi:response regulator transcription factor [Georgenia muralis]|uniref:DNA-binding response OmpR family regulator n=1 Tax=Georgenia muralis TaxID=154117 RepID=A0A3N4Z3Z8_9MICO|nr:response regulator transcription factor [Georgenia muralis]RPF26406.1 DNA-binding response OmpR family regulator [Georgenia muralis]